MRWVDTTRAGWVRTEGGGVQKDWGLALEQGLASLLLCFLHFEETEKG